MSSVLLSPYSLTLPPTTSDILTSLNVVYEIKPKPVEKPTETIICPKDEKPKNYTPKCKLLFFRTSNSFDYFCKTKLVNRITLLSGKPIFFPLLYGSNLRGLYEVLVQTEWVEIKRN